MGTGPESTARRSRRPTGAEGNRQAILASARQQFSEHGYDATIRGIAAGAGVDPALVHHYFGSKDRLLIAALHEGAAGQTSSEEAISQLVNGDPGQLGSRLIQAVFAAYETPLYQTTWRSLIGLLRTATTREDAAAALRESLTGGGIGRLLEALGAQQPELRLALIGSELFGLAMARFVVRLEPIASADIATLGALYGPTLQRYLTGALPVEAVELP